MAPGLSVSYCDHVARYPRQHEAMPGRRHAPLWQRCAVALILKGWPVMPRRVRLWAFLNDY
jgi:hypothetical protein